MINNWMSYIDGARQLRMAIDTADDSCVADVDHLSAVPLPILETMLTDKVVYM